MSLSRRDLMKLSLGAAVFGSRADLVSAKATSLVPCDPLQLYAKKTRWTNKHGNVSLSVERLYQPVNRTSDCLPLSQGNEWKAGLSSLKAIVGEAERQRMRVRAVGGTWSLSTAAVCPDFMIDTTALNYHAPISPTHVLPSSPIPAEHLFFAQCGTSVMELNTDLQERSLCLRTSGASQGQSICGAFSTGTHGSAIELGAMQDYIVGMHLLVDGGKDYWLEPASRPIVNDAFCAKLRTSKLSDDEIFHAALVSFGSFGVIHAVLLEVEPIYSLRVTRQFMDWDDIRSVAGTLDFSSLPEDLGNAGLFHFEVDLNPYATQKGGKGASVVVMSREPYSPVAPCPDTENEFGVDTLAIVGSLARAAPSAVPGITDFLFHQLFTEPKPCEQGPRGNVFGATQIKGKSMSCEIGVELRNAIAATEILVDAARRFPFPGVLALRYVRPSKAKLAFTKFAPATCTIEIPAAGSKRTIEFYEKAFAALCNAHIPYTLHWGQMNNFTPKNVRNMWGSAVDEWIAARHRLLTSAHARLMFSNDLLTLCGLDA